MSTISWEALLGTTVADSFVLQRVLQQTPGTALFQAHANSQSGQPEAMVQLIQPQEPPQTVVNRLLEASYLRHPNLAGISAAGWLEQYGLAYAVTEPIDGTLAQWIAERRMPVDDATELVDQIVPALEYLHAENLVFCNLRPESIWRTAAQWKLGDFSQMRVIGRGDSRELRAALARRPDLPPEVYEGSIAPAWDVWSLGILLRRILGPPPVHAESLGMKPRDRLRNADLPRPFDTITRDCLHPDANDRIGLNEIRARLRPVSAAPRPAIATPRPTSMDRAIQFLRTLPSQRPRVKAVFALVCAALLLAILVSANALMRHDGPPPPVVAETPAPVVTAEADRSATPPTAHDANGLPGPVKALLDTWVSSTRARDVVANTACYGPVVDTYFNKQRLSHRQIVDEKTRQFRTMGPVRRFGIDNVQFKQFSPGQAVVLFDKQWSFGDRAPFSGAERGQLNLRNINGEWKITGERELKVYWVRKGRAAA